MYGSMEKHIRVNGMKEKWKDMDSSSGRKKVNFIKDNMIMI